MEKTRETLCSLFDPYTVAVNALLAMHKTMSYTEPRIHFRLYRFPSYLYYVATFQVQSQCDLSFCFIFVVLSVP
jgi:hypothetical protein